MTTLAAAPETDLQSYGINGYYIARGLFNPAEVATNRDTFMEMARNGPVDGLSETYRFRTGRTYSADDPLAFYPRMMQPHTHPDKIVGPLSLRYLLDERVRQILHNILGEEPIAAQSTMRSRGSRCPTPAIESAPAAAPTPKAAVSAP